MKSQPKIITSAILAAALSLASSAQASQTWDIQGKAYEVDTLYHAQAGPGITVTKLKLSGAYEQRVFVTSVDLTNEYSDIHVYRAFDEDRNGQKALSKVADERNTADLKLVSGTNGDFFNGGGTALGSTVSRGIPSFISSSDSPTYWYITDQDNMGVGNVSFKGTAVKGVKKQAFGLNTGRGNAYAVTLYTHHYGKSYKTNGLGYGVRVKLIEGQIACIGKAKVQVVGSPVKESSDTDNTFSLAEGEWALTGQGNDGKAFIQALKDGDKVTLNFETVVDAEGCIREMVGGYPVLLRDGVVQDFTVIAGKEHLENEMTPRTAAGYTADGKTAILAVLDGRQGISKGFFAKQWADVLRNIGCAYAVNLDGGGSSEMYMTDFGMLNRPNGGLSERPVANSIWAVSTAPADAEVAKIAFEAHATVKAELYSDFTPVIYAYNRYGNLVDTEFKDYTLSCDPALGTVSDDGKSVRLSGSGTHLLTATYGDCSANILVEIDEKSAVSDIEISESEIPVEYFNLQGLRVENPENGIFIRRQGNKVTKVIK